MCSASREGEAAPHAVQGFLSSPDRENPAPPGCEATVLNAVITGGERSSHGRVSKLAGEGCKRKGLEELIRNLLFQMKKSGARGRGGGGGRARSEKNC